MNLELRDLQKLETIMARGSLLHTGDHSKPAHVETNLAEQDHLGKPNCNHQYIQLVGAARIEDQANNLHSLD